MTTTTWRDVLAVHPVADVFPLLPPDQLRELAKDIEQNGMRVKPIFWTDPTGKEWLLDGRNRLDAMEQVLGWPLVEDGRLQLIARAGLAPKGGGQLENVVNLDGADPVSTIIGVNIHRRHLTKLQKASIIIEAVKAGHAWRNDIAESARSFNPINGKRGGSTPDPVRQEVLERSTAVGISTRTAEQAMAQARERRANGVYGKRHPVLQEIHEKAAEAGISRHTTNYALAQSMGKTWPAKSRILGDINAILGPRTIFAQRLDAYLAANPSPEDRARVAKAFARLADRVQALAAKVQPAKGKVAS